MFEAVKDPYLVPFDGRFDIDAAPTSPPSDAPSRKKLERGLEDAVGALRRLQRRLYASNEVSVLAIFQAMDAAGKDSTIRAVLTGVNPAGCQVFSFKRPSEEELDHDFLWRGLWRVPERGRIGIFNRSWYEEVLVVRVHPELVERQRLPWRPRGDALWGERFESIRDAERHLARNGTVIVKFFLHVSRQEQQKRLLSRIDDPDKNWKFEPGDVAERDHWSAYMEAYQEALRSTSRPWAPWYAIPADDKPYMRKTVAEVLVRTLESLDLAFPEPPDEGALKQMRTELDSD